MWKYVLITSGSIFAVQALIDMAIVKILFRVPPFKQLIAIIRWIGLINVENEHEFRYVIVNDHIKQIVWAFITGSFAMTVVGMKEVNVGMILFVSTIIGNFTYNLILVRIILKPWWTSKLIKYRENELEHRALEALEDRVRHRLQRSGQPANRRDIRDMTQDIYDRDYASWVNGKMDEVRKVREEIMSNIMKNIKSEELKKTTGHANKLLHRAWILLWDAIKEGKPVV